jgi:Uma2 family endonuclease
MRATASALDASQPITPEQLLEMPDGDLYELVDGVLVERRSSAMSGYVGARAAAALGTFLGRPPRGWLMSAKCSYQCFPGLANLVRKPTVSFIRLGRFPEEQAPEGHVRIPPDLVVEAVAPSELRVATDQRVSEYLGAGVRLVWVIDPAQRTVLVYRADGSFAGVRECGEVDGEDVLPGFKCPVRDLFLMPMPATAATT